ncbi:MAG: hypothetical protein ACHQKY_18045 [Terriglobia bacterium]
MYKELFICLILYCALPLFGQTHDPSCCRLTAAKPETAGVLKITVANVKTRVVTVFENSPDVDFNLRVVAQSGREMERTEYGKWLLTRERGGRNINWELKAGETMSELVDLGKLFKLTSGIYSVSISRDVLIGKHRIVLHTQATITIP